MSTPREREITKRDRARRHSTSMEFADRPDLALARDRGLRQRSEGGWVENLSGGFLKICDFLLLLFFFTIGMLDTSEPCRHLSEKRKKKKKKKGHSPDIGIRRVVSVPMSDTDTTPKMVCPCNLGYFFLYNT